MFKIQFGFLFFYFLLTLIFESARKLPTYIDNLNWLCLHNVSYLTNLNTRIISFDYEYVTCDQIPKSSHVAGTDDKYFDSMCKPVTTRYYCGDDDSLPGHPWSLWNNALLFVCVVVFL